MAAVLGRGALAAASNVNWSQVGSRAVAMVQRSSPAVLAKAENYMATATGGMKTLSQMADSKSPVTQTAVLKALFESGMSAVDFAEGAALSVVERKQYSDLIAQYRELQYRAVDSKQANKPTTSDPYLDRLAVNIDIKKVCTMLGISSDDYNMLVRSVNTHTSKDVEMFQLDRAARSERFI